MTEVTRVPLQPIAQGALTKLWLGVLAVALAAAGLAWASMPPGVELTVIKEGTGTKPTAEDVVWIKYVGKTGDGTEFQRTPDNPLGLPPSFPKGLLPDGVPMEVNKAVPGFTEGLLKMQKGGKYTLRIPAEKGYGANPPAESQIPPNSELIFDVEVVDVMTRKQVEERFAKAREFMAQFEASQGGGAGAEAPAKDAPKSVPQTR